MSTRRIPNGTHVEVLTAIRQGRKRVATRHRGRITDANLIGVRNPGYIYTIDLTETGGPTQYHAPSGLITVVEARP